MESSFNSFPHEPARIEYELNLCQESDWEYDELSWSFHDALEANEEPEEDDVFYTDDATYSDVEDVQEADEELSVDQEDVQDSLEYVHFGKGLEYDGEGWIWEQDVDFWPEMSR